jgi:hypothetical protein
MPIIALLLVLIFCVSASLLKVQLLVTDSPHPPAE